MKIRSITLGSTGITVPQNGFGALPVQRDDMDTAVKLLRGAYDGGMRFFDTARAYSDSEEKVGNALSDVRKDIFIATKSTGKDAEAMKRDLDTSLSLLKTDYIDIYQPHCVGQCYRPGDGTGIYELLADLKAQGVIRHIGITTHKIGVAEEIIDSGLYETIQFPLSYLSSGRELDLIERAKAKDMGYIAMKGLAGGLLTNAKACFAFMSQFDNVIPIWGIQREKELQDWLSFMENPVYMDEEISAFIEKEKAELTGEFCRGCGYCAPCSVDITINACARMSLMLRRAPSDNWLTPNWQEEMAKIENCIDCGVCMSRCPYGLEIPALLRKNLEDYRNVLAGKTTVK